MGESALDDLLQVRVLGAPAVRSPEGDQRGVHIRRRAKDRAGDRMEARALGGQLEEHGDRAVAWRSRHREKAVRNLSLNHHAP